MTSIEPALGVFLGGLGWPILWYLAWRDAHDEKLKKTLWPVLWWARVCILGGLGSGAMVVLWVSLVRIFAQKI